MRFEAEERLQLVRTQIAHPAFACRNRQVGELTLALEHVVDAFLEGPRAEER